MSIRANKGIFMMEDYPARKRYQDKHTADTYDYYHNEGIKGFLLNYLDKRTLYNALKNLQEGSTILDIPCGTGRITSMLLDNNYVVTGADISREMMGVCTEKLSHFTNFKGAFRCDITNILCKENTYDCVTSIRFFAHLTPSVRKEALIEISRISKKYALIEYSIYEYIAQLRRNLENLTLQKEKKKRFSENAFISKKELEKDARDAHFKIIDIYAKAPLLFDSFFVLFEKIGVTE